MARRSLDGERPSGVVAPAAAASDRETGNPQGCLVAKKSKKKRKKNADKKTKAEVRSLANGRAVAS